MNRLLLQDGKQVVNWPVLWIYSAALFAAGFASLYLLPPFYPASLAVMAIGILGVVVTAATTARARWRESPLPARSQASVGRLADAAAVGALVVAGLVLAILVLAEVVWPAIASSVRAGPCDQDPTVACFSAHPEYYQETAPGGYSTPVSRIADDIVMPSMLAAWPLGLVAALVSVVALVKETRRRRVAILGMILGSLTVAWMGGLYLAFLLLGGGE